MEYLAAICLALLAVVVWQARAHARERAAEHAAFAQEREAWVRERRDLNNRIQIPEVAPFLDDEDDHEAKADDVPVLPEFVMDEQELEKARRELASVGYEEGPVA